MSADEKLEWLTDADRQELDARRQWVYNHPGFFGAADTVEGKLDLIAHVLKAGHIAEGSRRYAAQCLGVVLGDAVAQARGMSWFMVSSAAGRAPCLGIAGSGIRIVTVTIIDDELTAGRPVDIHHMFDYFCTSVDRLKAETMRAGSA